MKPHGALYHATIDGAAQADAVVAAAAEYDPSLAVLGAPDSCLLQGGRTGRAGSRWSRRSPIAPTSATGVSCRARNPTRWCVDAAEVAARAVRLAVEHEVVSVDGTIVKVAVRSLCVHGDTPGAVDLARAVRDALDAAGVGVHPFTA